MIKVVNLSEMFTRVPAYWQPAILGEVNDAHVKIARLKGEFIWHNHEMEDELFFVIHGRLRILLRDGEVALNAGEFAIIPHGVEHCPVAEEEVHVLLLEPKSTLNTGSTYSERTHQPELLD